MFLFSVSFLVVPCVFGQPDTNGLPKLAPPYGPMPPTFWEQHGRLILAGSAVFILATGLAFWWICRPKLPVVVPAETQARETLAKWAAQPETGDSLGNISQVLRQYIVRAFEFPAVELTTAEFCRELEHSERIAPELAQAISSFLRQCDERKFSPRSSPAPLHAASRALELVKLAEQSKTERHIRAAEK